MEGLAAVWPMTEEVSAKNGMSRRTCSLSGFDNSEGLV